MTKAPQHAQQGMCPMPFRLHTTKGSASDNAEDHLSSGSAERVNGDVSLILYGYGRAATLELPIARSF